MCKQALAEIDNTAAGIAACHRRYEGALGYFAEESSVPSIDFFSTFVKFFAVSSYYSSKFGTSSYYHLCI
jgi:hypothetical protein